MSRAFIAVLAGYVVLAVAYTVWIPLWEAPDEPAHFLYVQHMAEAGLPPPPPPPQRGRFFEHGFVVSAYEWHQMPLYYGLAAPLLVFNRAFQWLPPFGGFPPINPDFPNAVRLFTPQPFAWSEAHLLRWFSVLLGGCTLIVIGGSARRLFPHEARLPELAAGFVAFIPQYTFLHAYITNDALAILLSALGAATLIHVAMSGPTELRRAWVYAGFTGAAALATKMTAWFVVPLGLLLWIVVWAQGKRRGRAAWLDLAVYGVCLLSIPLAAWLLWPDLATRLAHSPQATSIRPEFVSAAYLVGLLPTTHASFWGVFGWMNVATPAAYQRALDGLWLVGLTGAGVWLMRNRRVLADGRGLALALLLVTVGVVFVQFLGFNLTITQPQGRFLYAAVMGPAILAALGWLRLVDWTGAARRREVWVAVCLGALALGNLLTLLWILRPAYG